MCQRCFNYTLLRLRSNQGSIRGPRDLVQPMGGRDVTSYTGALLTSFYYSYMSVARVAGVRMIQGPGAALSRSETSLCVERGKQIVER